MAVNTSQPRGWPKGAQEAYSEGCRCRARAGTSRPTVGRALHKGSNPFVISTGSPYRSHHPCTWALSADGNKSGAPRTPQPGHLDFPGTPSPKGTRTMESSAPTRICLSDQGPFDPGFGQPAASR